MVIIFELDEDLLREIEKDINRFLNRVIDISNASTKIPPSFDIHYAGLHGITQKDVAVQLIEEHIRELAFKANIDVICLVKEQVQNKSELIEKLQQGRIILLK